MKSVFNLAMAVASGMLMHWVSPDLTHDTVTIYSLMLYFYLQLSDKHNLVVEMLEAKEEATDEEA